MTKRPDGGAAFPNPNNAHCDPGMTLRDYFAAKVLPAVYAEYCESTRGGDPVDRGWRDDVAMGAYKLADAMLEAREA